MWDEHGCYLKKQSRIAKNETWKPSQWVNFSKTIPDLNFSKDVSSVQNRKKNKSSG
jgi:hypothetical protein